MVKTSREVATPCGKTAITWHYGSALGEGRAQRVLPLAVGFAVQLLMLSPSGCAEYHSTRRSGPPTDVGRGMYADDSVHFSHGSTALAISPGLASNGTRNTQRFPFLLVRRKSRKEIAAPMHAGIRRSPRDTEVADVGWLPSTPRRNVGNPPRGLVPAPRTRHMTRRCRRLLQR